MVCPSLTSSFVSTERVEMTGELDPFGNPVSVSETVTQPFRFAGREYDGETGLYFMRSRYYDPQLGRFISEDPIGVAGGINPYEYAGNDPINRRDASGLDYCFWMWGTYSTDIPASGGNIGGITIHDYSFPICVDDGGPSAPDLPVSPQNPFGPQGPGGPGSPAAPPALPGNCGGGRTQSQCDARLRAAIKKVEQSLDPGCSAIGHALEYGFSEDALTGQFRNWFIPHSKDVVDIRNGVSFKLAGQASGSPSNWKIDLYPDAYRSVRELAVTIVHEFVHILDPRSGNQRIDRPNGPAERVGQYCVTGRWPALKSPNLW
jgi:RHS repeat-associated protein